MESGNLLSLISKLIKLNKDESETNYLTQLNLVIEKKIKSQIETDKKLRGSYVISDSRQLALEQLRNMN